MSVTFAIKCLDKKGAKIVIFNHVIVVFSTEKENVLHNYSLIITTRIVLKSLCFEFQFLIIIFNR